MQLFLEASNAIGAMVALPGRMPEVPMKDISGSPCTYKNRV